MATWRERFEELSAEEGRQNQLWKDGNRNHNQLRASMNDVAEHLRQYEAAGEPDRDTEMS